MRCCLHNAQRTSQRAQPHRSRVAFASRARSSALLALLSWFVFVARSKQRPEFEVSAVS